jgi:hypothetical protein
LSLVLPRFTASSALAVADLFRLPGPRRFIQTVANTVRDGRGAVIAMPDGSALDLARALESVLDPEGYSLHRVDGDLSNPAAVLIDCLGIPDCGAGINRAGRLISHASFRRGDVLIVEMQREAWPVWESFLDEFETTARAWDAAERPRILVLWPAASRQPGPAITTPLRAIHRWQGRMSDLDVRLHVGERLLASSISAVQRRLLTEMIVSLALWDLDLADELLELRPQAFDLISPVLRSAAEARGWSSNTDVCWEAGTCDEFDGSIQVHSALAQVSNRTALLQRRQWEAQAAVVLPIVDRSRRDLIAETFSYLKTVYPDVKSPDDLFEREIGPIAHRILTRFGEGSEVGRWAANLKWYRNELAHLRPVQFSLLFRYLDFMVQRSASAPD